MKANLSVIIPVYNEKKTILEILDKVKKQPEVLEILIIEDSSTDGTKELLQNLKDPKIRIFFNEKNLGKGTSVIQGFKEAKGKFIIIQDADLEYNPEDYSKLIEASEENTVIYGSRFLNSKIKMLWWIYLGNKFLTYATNFLFGSNLTDMTTCYKLIPKDILDKVTLTSRKFEIDLELTAAFLIKGYKIKEIKIDYQSRNYNEGKKITWIDGLRDILLLFKYRFFNSF